MQRKVNRLTIISIFILILTLILFSCFYYINIDSSNNEFNITDKMSSSMVIYPIVTDDFYVTQQFGVSSNVSNVYSTHSGTDYASSESDVAVISMSSGTVINTVTSCSKFGGYINNPCGSYFGNHIIIKSEQYLVIYAHLANVYVSIGDTVKLFDIIATMGNSGNTSGKHLHFELRNSNNVAVDPQNLLIDVNRNFINNYSEILCLTNNDICENKVFFKYEVNFKNSWILSKISLLKKGD